MASKSGKGTIDYELLAQLVDATHGARVRAHQVPRLDEEGNLTDDFYDSRLGKPEGQPDPARLARHFQYMQQRYGPKYQPQVGEPLPEFNVTDPFESEGLWDSFMNMLASGYGQSITGEVEKLFDADDVANLFGMIDQEQMKQWQPNVAEQIGSGIASFVMPLDLATLAAGGTAGVKLAQAAKLTGRIAPRVLAGSMQIGTYEGARGAFEGGFEGMTEGAMHGMAIGAAFGAVGGAIPEKVLGQKIVAHAARTSGEVFTLATVSPFIEGRTPTKDDFINAAGFIVGIKAVGGLAKMPKTVFNRRTLKAYKELEKRVREGEEPEEAFLVMANQAIKSQPERYGLEIVRKIWKGKEGAVVGTLGDFYVGEGIRKTYGGIEGKVLGTKVKVSRKVPADENASGWLETDAKGRSVVKINPDYPDRIGISLIHEGIHALQRSKGRPYATEQAEAVAGRMERRVARAKEQFVVVAPEPGVAARRLEPTPIPPGKAPAAAPKPVSKPSKGVEAGRADKWIVRLSDAGVDVSRSQVKAKKGKGLKPIYTIKEIEAKSAADRLKQFNKVSSVAHRAGRSLYVSPELAKSPLGRMLLEKGRLKQVGKRFKVVKAEEAKDAERLRKDERPVRKRRVIVRGRAVEGRAPVEFAKSREPGRAAPEVKAGEKGIEKAVEPPTPKAKQPWEMSQGEFAESIGARPDWVAKGYGETGKTHKRSVEAAIAAGKIKSHPDYPELGKKVAPKGEPPEDVPFRRVVVSAKPWGEKAVEKVESMARAVTPAVLMQLKTRLNTFPAGRQVHDMLDKASKMWHRVSGTFLERTRQEAGVYEHGLIGKVLGKTKGMPKERREQLTDETRGRDDQGRIVKATPAALAIRKIFLDAHDYFAPIWKKAGLTLGKIERYIPRFIKDEINHAIYGDLKKLNEALEGMGTFSELTLNRMLVDKSQYIIRALEHVQRTGQIKDLQSALRQLQREVETGLMMRSPFERERAKLSLPSDFYEKDIGIILARYFTSMSKRAAELEVFGNEGKVLKLLAEVQAQSPENYRMAKTAIEMFTGEYERRNGFTGKAKKIVDGWTGVQFALKIGLGRATLLNSTQWAISFGMERGIWPTIKGAVDLFDPAIRSEIRKSGAVQQYLMHAALGYKPGGWGGVLADKLGNWSGFMPINKFLQYWAGSVWRREAVRMHHMAQGEGVRARWAQKELADLKLTHKKPMEAQGDELLESVYRFATDTQLQRNILRDPLFMNKPHVRPFVLFKRFGLRQATNIKDVMWREMKRGNVMPIIRLGVTGFLGGEGVIWALNKIKSILSGEPVYRKDDDICERLLNNLAIIGSFGVLSDAMEIERASQIAGKVKFAITPVPFADAEQIFKTWTKFTSDWERYGDGWLATRRNAYTIFGFLGSYPRYASARLKTQAQKERRISYLKGREKREIFQLWLDGNHQAMSDRVAKWNNAYEGEDRLSMEDISTKAMLEWIKRKAKTYAETEAGKGTIEAKRLKYERRRELLKDFRSKR